MKTFTIERSYLVPIYQHVTVEAETLEAAIANALDDNEHSWDSARRCDDDCRSTYVSGAWLSDEAYSGEALPVPAAHRDWTQDCAGKLSDEEKRLILAGLGLEATMRMFGDGADAYRAGVKALIAKIEGDAHV